MLNVNLNILLEIRRVARIARENSREEPPGCRPGPSLCERRIGCTARQGRAADGLCSDRRALGTRSGATAATAVIAASEHDGKWSEWSVAEPSPRPSPVDKAPGTADEPLGAESWGRYSPRGAPGGPGREEVAAPAAPGPFR